MARGVARGATGGFAVLAEGLRLVLRERRLWRLAVVPFGLSLLAVSGVLVLVVTQAGALFDLVAGWLPEPTARSALDWLWVAPARVGLRLLGALLFVAAAGVLAILAYLVASVVSAPFHDALARRVEEIVAGAATDLASPGLLGALRDGGRAVREELVRLAFFLAVQGAIGFAGLLVPGGQVLAPPAMVLFTLLFLPLDYASYALDRRRLTFREKRRWILEHRGVMLGFGVAAFGVCVVPGLNLLAMPVLVVAGTLLVLRNPPSRTGPGPGEARATRLRSASPRCARLRRLRSPRRDPGGGAGTATST